MNMNQTPSSPGSDQNQKPNRKPILLTILCLLLIAAFVECLVLFAIAGEKRKNKEQEARIYGQNIANAIQMTMDKTVEAAESLKYIYLNYGESFFIDFNTVASRIAEDHPAIASMYIAPKGVIRVAWPEEVNASTIGFAMLEDPDQGPRAQLAIDTGKITVAGPHDLVEGGVGFIIRNPLFKDQEFIGFTIIVLDWDLFVRDLLANTNLPGTGYKFAVWKEDHDETAVTDEDGFIFRNTGDPVSDLVDIEFSVPNDIWHLYVEPIDGWVVLKEMVYPIVLSLTITAFVFFFFFSLNRISERNKQLQHDREEAILRNEYMNQLSAALDEAKRANSAKSAFLSRMSHDIRTPLNGIIGIIELNDLHSDDIEYTRQNRAKARVAANHLLSLISDVLNLSKLDNDTVQLAHDSFSFPDMLTDVLTITEIKATEAGVHLNRPENLKAIERPFVYGSPLHVRQVFLNILGNAVKYNRPGGSITCSIETPVCSDRSETFRVVISDTGIGMNPDFIPSLFEPFSQEHYDARSVYQGTGLGMSIVKRLIDKMGGSIEVTSEPGKGSSFTVTLTFEPAEPTQLQVLTDDEDETLDGLHILIVEDNELNMEIAEEMLSIAGAVTAKAVNGQKAVDLFVAGEPGTYDAILMDLMMPVMDGYEATRAIRHLDRPDAATIPIIAMTANAFTEDAEKCLAAGMNAHLAKPIDMKKVVHTLRSFVNPKGKTVG